MEIRNGDIVIRPLKEEDKFRLAKWLSDPVVLQYYEGRDSPFTIEMVEEKFINQSDEAVRCIFIFKGKEIGYVQYYPIDEEEWIKYGYNKANEVIYGSDQFIGETDYWNRGIGTLLIDALKNYLVGTLGVDRLVMDPMVWNERAIKCYEKCGYRKVKILPQNELHEGVTHDAWLVEYADEHNYKKVVKQ
jgi:RimJ/RimL family protein N-acetyltransferase